MRLAAARTAIMVFGIALVSSLPIPEIASLGKRSPCDSECTAGAVGGSVGGGALLMGGAGVYAISGAVNDFKKPKASKAPVGGWDEIPVETFWQRLKAAVGKWHNREVPIAQQEAEMKAMGKILRTIHFR
ncbi:hypothetical protein FRB96_007537 [Tulasnella sp. 330]|nr:hypothetical protein FRB96_007537 [Tulasnella sp. 330]KAG8880928.1 hypothetical protein FRB97_000321 [Tulasnella sp. 331]KAG8889589.1 hypothetical protein FRB98_003651 [Tulasnella sp. 332]